MKKNGLLFLLAWVLVGNVFGQTQLNTWTVGLTDIKMSANPITAAPIKNSTLPLLQNFNIRNSVCDRNGDVIFYVGDDRIVDRFGKVVCELESIPGQIFSNLNTEMPVVPCIELNPQECLKKYYVFYTRSIVMPQSYRTVLFAKLVSVNCNTGKVTAQDIVDTSNPSLRREIYNVTYPSQIPGTRNSFAVSKVQGNSRFLYYVSEPGIQKIILTDVNSPNQGINAPTLMVSGTNAPGFSFGDCQQANLSTQGNKLAWAVRQNANEIDYFVIGINPATGDFNGTKNKYPFITPAPAYETALIKGVEFSEDGTLLYTSSTQGLYSLNLSGSGMFNQIASNSLGYADTQLELGPDGKVYARRAKSIASISKNGTSFPTSIIPITSVFPGAGQPHTLPDQIDGENYYPYLVSDFFDASDYTINPQVLGTITYTQTSNPINTTGRAIRLTGLTRIAGDASRNSILVYRFEGMTFEMAEGATIEIMDNAEVHFLNCKFRSAFCSGLWNGIEVNGNGTLIADYISLFPFEGPVIRDAINGIKVTGGQATINLKNVNFIDNLTCLKIIDYKPFFGYNGSDVSSCAFRQQDPLKQSPLNPLPSGSPLYPFGQTGIDISTTKVPNQTILKIEECRFEGGKKGININRAPLIVSDIAGVAGAFRSRFNNFTHGNAIYIEMGRQEYPVVIKNSDFTNVQNAITSVGTVDLKILNNTITNTNQHAISIDKNYDGSLEIVNNTLTNFYQSGILISNSATITSVNPQINGSIIKIYNNTFSAPLIMNPNNTNLSQLDKPTAITLSEVAKRIIKNSTYSYLRINNNTGNNIAYGIRANNIVGYNSVNKKYNPNYPVTRNGDVSDIDANSWNIYATYTPSGPIPSDYNTGIVAANSNKLRIALNTINSNQFTQWRSPGVYLDNAGTNLIFGNAVQAGRGIGGRFVGLGNDLSCNSFKRNVNGISLQDYQLRTWTGSLHGQQNVASRDNGYIATRDNDIELYTWKYRGWQPSVLQRIIGYNQWIMVLNPSVLIEPDPNTILGGSQSHINYLKNGTAPEVCGLPDDNWGNDDPNDPDPFFTQPPQSDDAFEQWVLQYEYISEQQALTGVVGNTFIDQLLVLQQHISQGDISVAINMLATMPQPSNVFEQNMLNVYQLWLTAQKENRNLNETELASLVQIATPNTYEIGIASYVARAILWAQEGLNFVDMVDRKNAGIGVKINFAPCNESLPADFTIELKDENDNIYPATAIPVQLDEEGYAYIAPQYVSTLSPSLLYTFQLQGGEFASPPLQTLHSWMDNAQGNIISLCNFGKSGGADFVNKKAGTSTTQKLTENPITVYPNPAKETATVQLPIEGTFNISIYDALGKQVYSKQHSGKQQLAIHQYEAGVYFVKINNANGDTVYNNRLLIVK